METLKGWRYSPEYTAAQKIGEFDGEHNVVAVDGVQQ